MRRMLVFAVMASIVSPALAQEESERDRKKNAAALFSEGLRAETEKPINLLLAISKYALAVKHAKDEKNNEVAAASLVHTGWCNEKLDPANIAGAKAAYEEVVNSFADTKPWGEIAKEKASYKGVDVHLKLLHAQLDKWRVTPDRSPLAMTDTKKAVADQILAGKAEAVPGLIWGLGHPDEVIRDFAADCIAQITDEPGITAVIAKLNDANPLTRAGASAALQKIYLKFNDSADLVRRAQELERDLATVTLQPKDHKLGELADAQHKKLADEAAKLRSKAAEIRAGIPENLATADIQSALQKILEDESAHAQARREAAVACRSIGRISGGLVDALVKAMDSKDHNVREAACRAAGGVDTSISTDKIKLADRLIKSVQDEPAKAADKSTADWANDEAVRQGSAEALEQIALVKTLPALIKALDDNDSRVRGAAFRALNRITNRDFEFEKDKSYEPDKPLPERKKAQEKWEKWWQETAGVVVLVERFWAFQSQWSQGSAVRLFDPAHLLKELDSKKWSQADPKIEEGRVKREIEEFQRKKDVFIQDAVDIGVPALDQLIKFIGGQTEREPKANAATRTFVAEAMARIIEKNNAADAVAKLKDAAGESDAARAAGGCAAIGFLPKAMVDAGARDALQSKGLGNAAAEVKEAAANALGKVGEEASAADLTRAAGDANQDVQIAALRALANIHPKNQDTIKALSDMVADEPAEIGAASKKVLQGAKADQVREYATAALGEIADPAAALALLRARRDTARNVREAASGAIQKVYKADGKALIAAALAILQSEKNKTDDRSGAALLLGDTGEAAVGRELAERLIDKNPPRYLRDSDSGVRIKICEALGNLKAKTKSACETGLLKCMADEYEREAVRDAAFQALSSIFAIPADDKEKLFKASDPKPARDAAIQKWKDFLAGQGLKDEA